MNCNLSVPSPENHIIVASAAIIEALEKINSLKGEQLTLFAVDSEQRVVGSVTDGDLRRALLAGIRLNDEVEKAMNPNFLAITPLSDTLQTFAEARRRNISLLPRLDKTGHLIATLDLNRVKSILPLDAVMMAGGRGERLRPLTFSTPKPLLKVGGKAIIDYNVEELEANGLERIFVTVNYLKEQIQEHFSTPRAACVKCVAEPKRLGTMGSLALVEGLKNENVLVMNSDLLTTISFENMFRHHIGSRADLTIATIGYNVTVPFAVLEIDGDRVTGLREKPSYNYSANAGVYILKRSLIERITPGEYLDAPDFIEMLIGAGKKVSHFPIDGMWIDIGSPGDFKYADELMSGRLR